MSDLRRTREQRYRLQALHKLEMESLSARTAELTARKHALLREEEAFKARIAACKDRIDASTAKTLANRADLEKAAGSVRRAAAALKTAIKSSIPFKQDERASSVEEYAGPSRGETVAARARAFQQVIDYEIALGSTSEVWTARVELGPDNRPLARCMRVGMSVMAFASGDTGKSGLLTRSAGGFEWKTSLDFSERWGLRRAMEILERRRPPVFVKFPIDLATGPRVNRPGQSREAQK